MAVLSSVSSEGRQTVIFCLFDVAHQSVEPFVARPGPLGDLCRATAYGSKQSIADDRCSVERLRFYLRSVLRQKTFGLKFPGLSW